MNISWEAPEHMYTEKNSDWYWIVGIVSVTLALISIILSNILFGIFILVSTAVLVLHANHPPKIITIKITEKGIQVADIFYPYSSLESFWIEEKELHPRIIIKSNSKFAPYIIVLLGEESNTEDIRTLLDTYIHEVKHSEPFLEKLLIWFGF